MDEIDFLLLRKLDQNSRLTYRKLAEITGISVSAVHKRINKLIEDGNIKAFIARPSIIALKYLWIFMFGTSKAKSTEIVSKELIQHENVKMVGLAGSKFLYISSFLRNISELQDFSSYVSVTAQINEPIVGIVNVPYVTNPEPLTNIDFKILKALNKDARKPISDIAEDTGLSAKTIKRRLDRMIENNLISFTIETLPTYQNSFVTIFHIKLNEGANTSSIIEYLNEKYSKNIGYCLNYSNIPFFLTLHIWTTTADASHKIELQLQSEGFKDVVSHILVSAKWGKQCWIDKLLRTK